MEITGRLTADAEVRKTKNGKEFLSFTLVVNDNYKTKDGEFKQVAQYFNCTYWQGSRIAELLTKASVLTVSGRIYIDEYSGKDGKHYASIACHVNHLKIIATIRNSNSTQGTKPVVLQHPVVAKEDLPF